MATAGSIVVDLLARTGSFETDMDRAARSVKAAGKEIDSTAAALGRYAAAAGAAGLAFATAAAGMAMHAAKSMDATAKMAEQIGTTTEALTGLRFAAKQFADVSDSTFDMALRRMTRRIEEAAAGSGGAKNALEALGLSAKQLAQMSPDQQFLALADAMQNTESQAQRLRYTMAIFDTEGMPLVAALQRGSAEMEKGIETARRYGLVLSTEAAQAAQQLTDNIDALQYVSQGFRQQIAEAVLPSLVAISERMVEISQSVGPVGEQVERALKVAGVAAGGLAVILTGRLVASALGSAAAFAGATFEAYRYQMALARMAGVSATAATAIGGITAATRAGSLLMGVLGGPAGLIASIGLTAAGFYVLSGSSDTAKQALNEITGSAEDASRAFEKMGALSRQAALDSLSSLHAEQARAASKAWHDFVSELEPTTARGTRAVAQMRSEMRSEVQAIASDATLSSSEIESAIDSLIGKWVEERRITEEQAQAYRTLAAGASNLQDAANQTGQRFSELSEKARELETATRGAAGGVNTLNQAMGFSEAGEKYLAQIQGRIKALQDSGDPIKIASRYIAEHTNLTEADRVAIMSAAHAEKALMAARDAAARSTKAGASAINDAKKAAEAFRKEQERSLIAQFQSISAIHEQAQGLEDQVKIFGQSKTALEGLTIARLEEEAVALRMYGDRSKDAVEAIEREIEARKRLRAAMGSLEQKEAERASWEGWARDVEQIFDRVGQSLTDAIFDGGKSGRDLLRDLFKGLTFNILINPVMNQMQGWVTNQLGGLFGVQNPQQQGSSGFSFGGGSTFGAGAVQTAGDWLLRSGLAPETGAKMLMNADSIATSAGNILGYGKAIWDLTEGRYGSAVGTAIGQFAGGPIGAAVGSMLGGVVDGLFDREPTTRRGQRARVDYADGGYGITSTDGRQAGAEATIRQITEQAVQSANELFRQLGVNAAIDSLYAITESSIKGDRQGVASGGQLRIDDQLRAFGVGEASDMTIRGFGGWSEADMLSRLAMDLQVSTMEAFQRIAEADQLPRALAEMIEGVYLRGLGEADLTALTTRFSAVIEQVSAFQIAVERLPFAQLRDLSFDAYANLIQFAGGLENLDAGMTAYFENFYSEAEQLDWLSQQLGSAFSDLGMTMPDVTQGADAAKTQFRDIVESLDLTTEWGQQAYSTMMLLSGSFAELVTGMESLNPVIDDVTSGVDALSAAAANFQGAAQAAQRAMQMVSTGGALADRIGGMLGLDPVFAMRREQELWATIGTANYEQQLDMAGELTDMVLNRISKEQQANQQRLVTIREELTNYRRMRDIGLSLQTYLGSLESSNLAPYSLAEKVSNAEADLSRLVSAARGGDENAARQVQGALQNALTLWRDYGASGQEYQEAYHRLTGMVGNLANAAVSDATRQIAQLEAQSAALEGMSGISAESLAQLQQLYDITTAATEAAYSQYQSELANANTELALLEHMGLDTARLHDIANLLQGLPAQLAAQIQASSSGSLQYMLNNPDVTAAHAQYGLGSPTDYALEHYSNYGQGEGRNFNATREEQYLLNNSDVLDAYLQGAWGSSSAAEAARDHYDRYGRLEGRAFALGGLATPGWAMVGERGPEFVDFRTSGRVYSASQTNDILRSISGGGQNRGSDELLIENRRLNRHIERLIQRVEMLEQAVVGAVIESSRESAKQITTGVGESVGQSVRAAGNKQRYERRGLVYDRS